ncbi:phosphate/phosphite/phosphonate ABC transporter substrate-binding protein [Priestia endophytica]
MFKKLIGVSMSVALAAGVLAGCGNNEEASTSSGTNGEGAEKKELTVQFVPSQNADTLEAKAKPLEKLLSDELDRPVKVSVSTDYNTIVEAMASKKVDVGFLPPTAYVLAKDQGAADVILQAQRYGVNNKDGSPTDELVDSYKSMFIVKKDSGIDSLEDLKGKKIGYQNVTSSAGYVWPAASLMDVGLDPLKDVQPVTLKGHDQAVISLLNGDIDAAVTFQDARTIVQKDYEDVFDQTKVIHYTEPIPNDTVAVQSDMDEDLRKDIQEAFINIGKDEEGKKIIRDIYTHEGYVKADDSKFEIVREYGERVKTE